MCKDTAIEPGSGPVEPGTATPLTGTFRSPRGRRGDMKGAVRVLDLEIGPREITVTGAFTGALHEEDGSLIGVDSCRATFPADIVRRGHGYVPVLRPFHLDLMGLSVQVGPVDLAPTLVQGLLHGPAATPS